MSTTVRWMECLLHRKHVVKPYGGLSKVLVLKTKTLDKPAKNHQ